MTEVPKSVLVIILAVVFTAVLSVAQGLYWAWVAKQEQEQEELRRRLGGATHEEFEESLFREEAADQAARALGSMGQRIQIALNAAESPLTVTQLVTRMLILGGVGAVVLGLWTQNPLAMLLGIPIGLSPYAFIAYQGGVRTDQLLTQLPDSLELMARALQAGVGLNDAFRLVAEEMPMPIAGEFARVFEEVRFGRDYREAFEKMLDRNPGLFDLRLFVSSILLQRETGGNLIEILENIAETIRSRFAFKAKVRAMTAEAKFSAIILGGLPFAVLTILSVSNPAYLNPLFNDIKGNVLLTIDVVMYSTGVLIMRDMTNVEV